MTPVVPMIPGAALPNTGKMDENGSTRLATGIIRRNDAILLVASVYRTQPEPLWNLPGGRVAPGELLADAVKREIAEETGLDATISQLAYVSESYDPNGHHFLNATFLATAMGEPIAPTCGDHVHALRWVPIAELQRVIEVTVVREPLLAYLDRGARYAGYADSGIVVQWPQPHAD